MASKTSAPKTTKKAASSRKTSDHPSYVDMIKETILANPDDARTGVSRPQIKKYLATKYKLDTESQPIITQISQAIKRGEEKGVFNLPKGISGKIKLAPKRATEAKQEEKVVKPAPAKKAAAKPAAKKAAAPKAPAKKAPAKKAPVKKATSSTTKAAAGKKTAAKPAAKKPAAKKAAPKKKAARK